MFHVGFLLNRTTLPLARNSRGSFLCACNRIIVGVIYLGRVAHSYVSFYANEYFRRYSPNPFG